MDRPRVSILLATFNRMHFIREMLDSVLVQTFKDWECLIIDDGSTDGTEEFVDFFVKKDSRFKYFNRPDSHKKGLSGSRNYGLELARGDYIIFFDDDDIAHPQNLEICLNQLNYSSHFFCHYKKKSFSENLSELEQLQTQKINHFKITFENVEDVITNKIPMASCTVMWKKECFNNIKFDESLQYAEEWECYTRIIMEGHQGIGIDAVLYYNRKHSKSNTGEFWNDDPIRKDSKIRAVKLVAENLKQKNLLSNSLTRYFIQTGIFLKEKSVVDHVLHLSKANFNKKIKYNFLYNFYPAIVIGHRLKKKIKKRSS